MVWSQRVSVLVSLWVAVGFLTRIPVGDPSRGGSRSINVGHAVPWFPFVGAGIGALQGGTWWLLAGHTSSLVAAAVSTAIALLITGAFHHDGLADMADAFGGGWDVQQRMEILKDSRLGTYGTTALVMALIVEVSTLASLEPRPGVLVVTSMHVVGRALSVGAMLVAPVGGDGLGATYVTQLSKPAAIVSVGVSLLGAGALLGGQAWAIGPALLAGLAVVALSIRKIGGITGDVLGAVTVMSGVTMLVAASL